jgi:hypothetical protein
MQQECLVVRFHFREEPTQFGEVDGFAACTSPFIILRRFQLASSYATVGYGDIVLPQMWRTLGPVESIIGELMCGLSASFLFAIVSRLVDRETRLAHEPAKPHRAALSPFGQIVSPPFGQIDVEPHWP